MANGQKKIATKCVLVEYQGKNNSILRVVKNWNKGFLNLP